MEVKNQTFCANYACQTILKSQGAYDGLMLSTVSEII